MRRFDWQRAFYRRIVVYGFPKLLSFSKTDGKSVSNSILHNSSPDAFKLSVWSLSTPPEHQRATCQRKVPKAISCLWIQLQLSGKSNEHSLFGHTPFNVKSAFFIFKAAFYRSDQLYPNSNNNNNNNKKVTFLVHNRKCVLLYILFFTNES